MSQDARGDVDRPSVLVNFAEAHNVGHVIEALRYVSGHRAAVPHAHIGLVLNRAAPVELAEMCDAVDEVFSVPMYASTEEVEQALSEIPRDWDHVLDNLRRTQPAHADVVPGFADYYAASDLHFRAARGRAMAGVELGPTPGYVPDRHVRLRLPDRDRTRAQRELGDRRPRIAILPAGSSQRWLYPSARSWRGILDRFIERYPDAGFVLIGKLTQDERTTSSFERAELDALLEAHPQAIDAFDRPLPEQLALTETCDVFVSSHSGFGWAALAVETPWLTISGGRWPEVFFNHVPFVSLLPDPARFGRFSLYQEPEVIEDDDGSGPRSRHVSYARIRSDLDRIVDAAQRLIGGELDYETAMREHFANTLELLGDDRDALFSIDRIHERYTQVTP